MDGGRLDEDARASTFDAHAIAGDYVPAMPPFEACRMLVSVVLVSVCASCAVAPTPAVAAGAAKPETRKAPSSDAPFDGSSEHALTVTAAQWFARVAPEVKLTVTVDDPLVIVAVRPNGERSEISLDRIWAGCQRTAETCEASLRDYVRQSADVVRGRENEAPISRDQIVASLRPASYLDALPPDFRAAQVTEPFGGDLIVFYQVDLPHSARGLTKHDVEALSLSPSALHELVQTNLARILGGPAKQLADVKPNVATVLTGNFYESSRIFEQGEWKALAARFGGDIVVAVPDNDVTVVVAQASTEMLGKLRDLLPKMIAGAERPVSSEIFRWTDHGWVVENGP